MFEIEQRRDVRLVMLCWCCGVHARHTAGRSRDGCRAPFGKPCVCGSDSERARFNVHHSTLLGSEICLHSTLECRCACGIWRLEIWGLELELEFGDWRCALGWFLRVGLGDGVWSEAGEDGSGCTMSLVSSHPFKHQAQRCELQASNESECCGAEEREHFGWFCVEVVGVEGYCGTEQNTKPLKSCISPQSGSCARFCIAYPRPAVEPAASQHPSLSTWFGGASVRAVHVRVRTSLGARRCTDDVHEVQHTCRTRRAWFRRVDCASAWLGGMGQVVVGTPLRSRHDTWWHS